MLRFRSRSDLLLPLLVLALELASIAPLLALAASGLDSENDTGAPFIPALLVIALLGYWLARRSTRGDSDMRAQGVMLAGGVVLALVAPPVLGVGALWDAPVIGVAILAAGEAVLAWWRGMYYASRSDAFSADELSEIVRRSWIVLAGSLVLIPILNGIDRDPAIVTAGIALPVAALSAFVLLALGQVDRANERARRFGGNPPDRRQWLTFTAIFGLLAVVIAMGIGAAIGDDTARAILAPVIFVIHAIQFVLAYVLYGIGIVFIYPIAWLIDQLPKRKQQGQETPQQALENQPQRNNDTGNGGSGLPHWLQVSAEVLAVVIVIALVAYLISRTLRKQRTEEIEGESNETHESLWSRELAWNQLKALFRRDQHAEVEVVDLARTPDSVREAYRALLALAQRDGIPRRADETPAEFAARLRSAWPMQTNAVAALTREYELARYGEVSEPAADDRARQSWTSIWAARRESLAEQ
jgi:hypothetical protein